MFLGTRLTGRADGEDSTNVSLAGVNDTVE